MFALLQFSHEAFLLLAILLNRQPRNYIYFMMYATKTFFCLQYPDSKPQVQNGTFSNDILAGFVVLL